MFTYETSSAWCTTSNRGQLWRPRFLVNDESDDEVMAEATNEDAAATERDGGNGDGAGSSGNGDGGGGGGGRGSGGVHGGGGEQRHQPRAQGRASKRKRKAAKRARSREGASDGGFTVEDADEGGND